MNKRVLALLCLLLVLLSACSAFEGTATLGENEGVQEESATADVELQQLDVESPHSSVADMIEDVLPTVVNVRVESVNFDPLGEPQTQRGQGSGVVINEEGIILTNNHVVAGATSVEVVFNDDHGTMAGTVLGTAPEKDIAVIQVDAEDLDAIDLGRSSTLRLGDEAVAIGFPLGLGGPTVTKGIISALDRNIDVSGDTDQELRGLMQTDAAINPGNSGGALVDLAGNLVGINTAAAQAGAAENIGFAIHIDSALPIVREILNEPPEERAWLGVQIQSVNSAAVANQLGIDPSVRGALIAGLFPDSPAEEGGLQVGDVIIGIADQDIRSAEDLTTALTDLDPGATVTTDVVRGGELVTESVELGRRPTTIPAPEETP
ncbi:MAG: S1C family serine protease [Actinomycetota bacterium]